MAAIPAKADSVYDFLYVDLDRIGLLLSHFGQDGVIKELTRDASSSSGSSEGFDKLFKSIATEDERRGLTRKFDTQWLVPLRFLALIQDRLNKGIANAALGAFVQLEGTLSLVDTGALQVLYKEDSPLRAMAMNGAMENAVAQGIEFNYDNAQLEIDIVTSMPRQIHFHLNTHGGKVWSTLRPSGLITPPEELAAKHGGMIDGRWHVVGIKDAQKAAEEIDMDERTEFFKKMYPNKIHMSDAAITAEVRRKLFGRPHDAYGVTPLMIFRPTG